MKRVINIKIKKWRFRRINNGSGLKTFLYERWFISQKLIECVILFYKSALRFDNIKVIKADVENDEECGFYRNNDEL